MPHRSSFAGSYSVVSSPYPARRDPSLWATGYGAASSTALTVDPRARMGTAAGQQYQPQPQAYSHLGAFQAGARSSPASSHWQQPALGTPGAPHPAFDEPFLDLYPYPHPHPAVPYQSSSSAAAYPFVDDDFAYSTFDLSDEDLFGPSSAVAAAAPQTIFRGLLPTAPAPITPPSPVTSDVGRHRNDMVGQGSPWHFHQAPAQPLAYPSSSMRQGAAAAAPAPGGADPSFDADEREIEHFLALDGLLSPAHPSDGSSADRVHHSRSYTPSPSSGSHRSHTSFAFLCGPTSAAPASPISSDSLANLKPWALDMSAAGLSPTYAPVPSTSSGRGALLSPEDDLPGARRPRAVRLANAGGGSAKRERDDGEGSSSASAANLTSVKRIKVKTESQSTSIAPAPASSPTVKVGKRKGKAPSSCAECRRLKMKCNLREQQPCSSCVARGCPTVCPNGQLANMKGKRLVLADTEALHARITALEAALAVSFAREDPTLPNAGAGAVADAEGQPIHPLLRAEFVDGGAEQAEAAADEEEPSSESDA